MKIGIASPFELQMLEKYLYQKDRNKIKKIKGLGGTQPTQIAIQFIKMGYEVSIFTLSQDIKSNEYKIFKGKNLTIYIGSFRRGKKITLDFQYKEIILVRKMILFDKPDVLSCHWTYEFALAGILSKIPHLITVRDWSPEILKLTKKPYRFMRMLMSFVVFAFGNNFIPNSPYIERKIKFLKKKVLPIIPNGIDDSLFLENKKYFNQSQKLKIISINNGFGERKNVKTLIRAFNKVIENYPDIELYLVGDDYGIDEEAYKWSYEHNCMKNIMFVGKVKYKEVISLLDKVDLMIHPALEESFGNILVEAMARKVSIVAGNNSGAVPWVVKDAGLLIDVKNENEIVDSILYFIKNPDKLELYSKKGYNNAYNRFRLSNLVKLYLKELKRIGNKNVEKT